MIKPPGQPKNSSEHILSLARDAVAQTGLEVPAMPEEETKAFVRQPSEASVDRVAQHLGSEHAPTVELYRGYLRVLIARELEG